MQNTVSVTDGHKYSQSPSGLQRLKQRVNDILVRHGFDLIMTSAAEMLDPNDYSDAIGFDYLEVDEAFAIPEKGIVGQQIDVSAQGIRLEDMEMFSFGCPWFSDERSFEMNNFDQYVPDAGKMTTPSVCDNTAMMVQQQQPIAEPTRQTVSADIAPHFILNLSSDTLTADTITAAKELGQISREELNATVNLAMALCEAADAKGLDVDIAVKGAPTIEINLDCGIQVDDTKIVADADYSIEQ